MALAASPSRSTPSRFAWPLTRACGGNKPIMARNACVLPAPDSPMTPRHRPGCSSSETASTAQVAPYATERFSMRSSAASVIARLQRCTQSVAEQVESNQHCRQQRGGHEQHPCRRLHLLRAFVDEAAETGERLLHAEPEEAQKAFEQDQLRNGQRCVGNHRAGYIRHDVAPQDLRGLQATRNGGVDEF